MLYAHTYYIKFIQWNTGIFFYTFFIETVEKIPTMNEVIFHYNNVLPFINLFPYSFLTIDQLVNMISANVRYNYFSNVKIYLYLTLGKTRRTT